MKKKRRNRILSAVKIVIAAALLAWVLSGVHWSDYVETKADAGSYAFIRIIDGPDGPMVQVKEDRLWSNKTRQFRQEEIKPIPQSDQIRRRGFASTIKGIKASLLIMSLLGFVICNFVIALRWRLLLVIQDININLWEAVRLTFLGLFFNSVVPGTVGGDLVKAYYVARHTPRKAAVLVSIFVDRLLGLAELTLLAAVMLFVVFLVGDSQAFEAIDKSTPFVAVAFLAVVFLMAFLFSRRFRSFFHLQKLFRRLPVAHHIEAAGDAANLYKKHPAGLIKAIGMTFVAQTVWIGAIALLGMSMSLQVQWYTYFLYIPLIYVVGAVPLTPGGLGLVERLYVLFFATTTCGASPILAMAMLARLIPILLSLPGAWVAVTGARLPQAEAIEAELGIDDDRPDKTADDVPPYPPIG